MKLAILIIGTNKRLEGNQFSRIRREVRCMLLVLALCQNLLDFVGCTIKFGSDEPWTCEGIDKLINLAAPGVRSGCSTSKNDVTNRVDLRVWLTCIYKFTMICSLFHKEEGSNLPECRSRK